MNRFLNRITAACVIILWVFIDHIEIDSLHVLVQPLDIYMMVLKSAECVLLLQEWESKKGS